MPFNDENIRKMIKEQMDQKLRFSSSKKLTDSCRELIFQILEPDCKKRATIERIKQHIWITKNTVTPQSSPETSNVTTASTKGKDKKDTKENKEAKGKEAGGSGKANGINLSFLKPKIPRRKSAEPKATSPIMTKQSASANFEINF